MMRDLDYREFGVMSRRVFVLFSLQRALVGHIGNEVLGICADLQGGEVLITVYVEGYLSDLQREALSIVETEVWGDLSSEETVKLEIVENARQPLECKGEWGFLRLGCLVQQPPFLFTEVSPETQPFEWEFIVTNDPEHDFDLVLEAWCNQEMLARLQKIDGEWKTTFYSQKKFCELSWDQLLRIYETFDLFRREENARGR